MDVFEDDEDVVSAGTAEQRPAIRLDLVGAAEAATLLGIGRAALWERRKSHDNFPQPVAELRCGPIWFRWQIQSYQMEEERLGPRGWYGGRLYPLRGS
jgi:predicted DNA-binding transcriptional regulator AlpA